MFYRLKSSKKPGSWNSSYAAGPKLATDMIQTIGSCYMSSQLIHWCSLDVDRQIRPCPRELACSLIDNGSSRCLTPWLHNCLQSVRQINFKDAWGASGGMRNDHSRQVRSFRIQFWGSHTQKWPLANHGVTAALHHELTSSLDMSIIGNIKMKLCTCNRLPPWEHYSNYSRGYGSTPLVCLMVHGYLIFLSYQEG